MSVDGICFTCNISKRFVTTLFYSSTCNFSTIIFEFDIEWVCFSTIDINFFFSFIRVRNFYCWSYVFTCRSCWVNEICCCNLICWSIRISDSKVTLFIYTVLWFCWKIWVSSFNWVDDLGLFIFRNVVRICNIYFCTCYWFILLSSLKNNNSNNICKLLTLFITSNESNIYRACLLCLSNCTNVFIFFVSPGIWTCSCEEVTLWEHSCDPSWILISIEFLKRRCPICPNVNINLISRINCYKVLRHYKNQRTIRLLTYFSFSQWCFCNCNRCTLSWLCSTCWCCSRCNLTFWKAVCRVNSCYTLVVSYRFTDYNAIFVVKFNSWTCWCFNCYISWSTCFTCQVIDNFWGWCWGCSCAIYCWSVWFWWFWLWLWLWLWCWSLFFWSFLNVTWLPSLKTWVAAFLHVRDNSSCCSSFHIFVQGQVDCWVELTIFTWSNACKCTAWRVYLPLTWNSITFEPNFSSIAISVRKLEVSCSCIVWHFQGNVSIICNKIILLFWFRWWYDLWVT